MTPTELPDAGMPDAGLIDPFANPRGTMASLHPSHGPRIVLERDSDQDDALRYRVSIDDPATVHTTEARVHAAGVELDEWVGAPPAWAVTFLEHTLESMAKKHADGMLAALERAIAEDDTARAGALSDADFEASFQLPALRHLFEVCSSPGVHHLPLHGGRAEAPLRPRSPDLAPLVIDAAPPSHFQLPERSCAARDASASPATERLLCGLAGSEVLSTHCPPAVGCGERPWQCHRLPTLRCICQFFGLDLETGLSHALFSRQRRTADMIPE